METCTPVAIWIITFGFINEIPPGPHVTRHLLYIPFPGRVMDFFKQRKRIVGF